MPVQIQGSSSINFVCCCTKLQANGALPCITIFFLFAREMHTVQVLEKVIWQINYDRSNRHCFLHNYLAAIHLLSNVSRPNPPGKRKMTFYFRPSFLANLTKPPFQLLRKLLIFFKLTDKANIAAAVSGWERNL